MKKRISVMMLMVCVFSTLLAACGKGNDQGNSSATKELTTLGVLENVFASYNEEDKPLIVGGDTEHGVEGVPGEYNMEDLEGISSMFHITSDAVAMTDEAASAVHALNVNTFNSVVFHLKESSEKDDFAALVKESVLNTHWMCGFPEKLFLISVTDEYVISAFGNGEMMENFKNKVMDVYGNDAKVLVEETIE